MDAGIGGTFCGSAVDFLSDPAWFRTITFEGPGNAQGVRVNAAQVGDADQHG